MSARGLTLAVAESLTGGALCARIVDIPGASAVLRGGICTYATGLKGDLLDVDPDRLASTGPVDGLVAQQMAQGVRKLMDADIGLATTGVAGPGPADGNPAGTVHIACAHPGGIARELLRLSGGRSMVRRGAVDAALHLLAAVLDQ